MVSLVATLRGVELKIERATRHANDIDSAINDFTQQAFEAVVLHDNSESGEHSFVLAELRRPDNDTLGILIGEFLHNARSALDHLAWQLVHYPSVDPGVAKTPDDQIAFPLCSSRKLFEASIWKIKGAAVGVETMIETLQPYYTGKSKVFPGPGNDSLWLLQELNNWDKHRLLHVVENEMEEAVFLYQDSTEWVKARPPGRLEAGAELARYKLRPGLDAEVDVGFGFASGVTFDDGPAQGRTVILLNSQILYAVKQAVSRLRSFIAL